MRWEVKRHERLQVMAWCKQVEGHPGRDIPVVAFRQDGEEWRVVMRLRDVLPLLREECECPSVAGPWIQVAGRVGAY